MYVSPPTVSLAAGPPGPDSERQALLSVWQKSSLRVFSTVHKLSCRLQHVAHRFSLSAGSLARDLAGSPSNLPPSELRRHKGN